eukprot:gene14850-16515_t
MDEHGIQVVKPESWPDVVDLKSKSVRELHFTLKNASHHQHHQHHTFEGGLINFTLKFNGVLLAQKVTFQRVQRLSTEQYCTMKSLTPGKWKYDLKLPFNTSDAWNTCPTFNSQKFEPHW